MKDSTHSQAPLLEETRQTSAASSLCLSIAVALISALYVACTNPPPPLPPTPPPKVKNPLPDLPSTSEEEEINPELDPSALPQKSDS